MDTEKFLRFLCSNRPMDPTGPRAHVMQHRFFFLPEIPSPPFATPVPSRRPRRCRPVRRPAVLHAPLPSCRPAARVQLVRQHPPFPRLLCSFSRPRSSFPSGDDRASCAARCSSSHGGFAGDEYQTGVCLPILLPSHPAARNQTPKPLTYGICIRI